MPVCDCLLHFLVGLAAFLSFFSVLAKGEVVLGLHDGRMALEPIAIRVIKMLADVRGFFAADCHHGADLSGMPEQWAQIPMLFCGCDATPSK